jgi:putative nucleotidyltransferase with HDIG domain
MSTVLRPLSFTAKFFVTSITCAGLVILAFSVASVTRSPRPVDWLMLAALAALSGAFNIKVPSIPARISVAEAVVFTTALMYGREAATIVVGLDAIVGSLRQRTERTWYRAPFNVAAASLAIWLSIICSEALAEPTGFYGGLSLDALLLPLLALALCYFVLNTGFVALAMSFERQESAVEIWRRNFLWFGLNYLGGASFAAVTVSFGREFDSTVLAVLVPLVLITYLTFRASLGRLEDANRHVAQLNQLYLSTIETLAMTIDAKDQITHGHIRRVQIYAVELAKRLGLRDETQLKAIEAAALLHDMGKLAIPENILNKPGSLSSAEFETMKQHANIGAELLSAITFPYPVVPIVRHHHEHWDGSGYPSGISRTDIPLGARILAVVDCFDALTSDRPYRQRLSPEIAFQVLRERRGSVYDPLVVDTFFAAYSTIAPLAEAAADQQESTIDTRARELLQT